MQFKYYLTIIFIMMLMGCSKAAIENQHYFLQTVDGQAEPVATSDAAKLLQINDVQLADFLDEDGLVLQLDDITLNQAKNHLWAEDLSRQINRGLRARLSQKQQKFTIVGPRTAADLQLSVEIHAFHGRYDGLALTSGQWQLQNGRGQIQHVNRFALETKLSEPGYPALVRALSQNLDKLAVLIAEDLTQI